jgi:phosphoglycerate dehydrogenase-like enzyme
MIHASGKEAGSALARFFGRTGDSPSRCTTGVNMATILINIEPGRLSEPQLARIRAAAPEMQVRLTQDPEEIEALLPDIEIVVGGLPHHLLPKAENLRWLQQWGAGADWLLRVPEAAEHDFVLTSASGVHAIPISEQIIAYLLAFARGLHRAVCAQVKHQWHRETKGSLFELAGKTMVLVGVGAIGERTAEIAVALGMHVLGVRRAPEIAVPGIEAMYHPRQLLEILPQADFVVLTVPLTRETRGMIGRRELQAMKPSAYIINIGRGSTIQEDALIAALQDGQIAGAGLDVFATEPLPPDSPLWEMENVIITGHYAGMTPKYDDRAVAILLENLERYRSGGALKNIVDKRLGY